MQKIKNITQYFFSTLGITALFFGVTNLLFRLERFVFFEIQIPNVSVTNVDNQFEFLKLIKLEDLNQLPELIIDDLNKRTGKTVRELIIEGAYVYALLLEQTVVAQVVISKTLPVMIDTPLPLVVDYSIGSRLLGYLYTNPVHRGNNLAGNLISNVIQDLQCKEVPLLIAHISSTNLNSMRVFRKLAWQSVGSIISYNSRRLIFNTRSKHLKFRVK
ncbi:GNAT family N-acetyltransferase [Colwellia psychrerythraea]|uniref:FR47 domain protein n=1 Tax=Colwellia psychrerythraea TaxID=28229 RepID=A0A099L2V7_COLPS|nr:GNAT family N-acetyltransferase [Colwellia psychrerythraea]KGJ96790.1 FR47 domain protein [Colwellia psychrerythraea]